MRVSLDDLFEFFISWPWRQRKEQQIGKRLEEFRGLKEIADIRDSRTRKRQQAVTNKKGENVTDRTGIVNVFADFYEACMRGRPRTRAEKTEKGGRRKEGRSRRRLTRLRRKR